MKLFLSHAFIAAWVVILAACAHGPDTSSPTGAAPGHPPPAPSATLEAVPADENPDVVLLRQRQTAPQVDDATPGRATETTPPGTETAAAESPTRENESAGDRSDKNSPVQYKMVQPVLDDALNFIEAAQEKWEKGELENALEALDQAYALILEVDTSDRPKLLQQKEDLRFLVSKRILEIYASRNIVVNGNHDAIPLDLNRHVQAEIRNFTGPEKNFFHSSYQRSGAYRPMIVEALRAAGLPEELSWLPLIESGYKVKALSRARALGMWQFIPSTGYKFGLKRNKYIDERLDPVKATTAAIAYLKELHQIFGDWTTVMAAYNCGEGRVLRVIRSQNINYLDNFWDLYQSLPRETARYVPRFLATLHIVRNPTRYGLDRIQRQAPMTYETVPLDRQAHLRDIARVMGISEKSLRDLNPELRHRILPEERYPLRVPPGTRAALLAVADRIPVSRAPQMAYNRHRVRRGESLSTIAMRYRTSVQKIARANNLRRQDFIVAGQVLKIPQRNRSVSSKARTAGKPAARTATSHVVRRGDSLWNIARRYGTTTHRIQNLNGLKSTNLSIGQVLKIPGAKPAPQTRASAQTGTAKNLRVYLVKKGDNPYGIARQHNMSLQRLQRINRLNRRSKIYPGQKLYVD